MAHVKDDGTDLTEFHFNPFNDSEVPSHSSASQFRDYFKTLEYKRGHEFKFDFIFTFLSSLTITKYLIPGIELSTKNDTCPVTIVMPTQCRDYNCQTKLEYTKSF